MLNILDRLLNKITMYSLILWALRILAAVGLVLALSGSLGLPLSGVALTLVISILGCFIANFIFSRLYHVPSNLESYPITSVILALILPPIGSVSQAALVFSAAVIAVTSKYLVAYRGKHIFNPAAFGAAALGVTGLLSATWWVGNSLMWPLVLVFGLLIVRKIRRFAMFATFIGVSQFFTVVAAYAQRLDVMSAAELAITSAPLLFLGGFMLTEPSTMPPRRWQQVIFGGLVGFLYALSFHIGPLQISPEIALLIGNLFAFAVGSRYRLKLTLKEVQKVSDRVYNYIFTPDRTPRFEAGQYMEWTLAGVGQNLRGNRRTFTIASSPTESDVIMGVKFYEPSSKFKRVLRSLKPGATVYAGQTAGDFVLPSDTTTKLAFIAGGIGITPFRSMLKYIIDTKQTRDVILIYAVSDASEITYQDVLTTASKQGIRVIPVLTNEKASHSPELLTDKLDRAFIAEQIPDHSERLFYISGPDAMVRSTKRTVNALGSKGIKTDYFSGY